mmetsp:Transcript_22063/g.63641  ORF Transcript_22063/g.63641 Transcript_22063/m.63641 type:complete len:222 (+) Transcript_22063:5557-6222(+)
MLDEWLEPDGACGFAGGFLTSRPSMSSGSVPMLARSWSAAAAEDWAPGRLSLPCCRLRSFALRFSLSEFTMMEGPMATGPCLRWGCSGARPPSAARRFSSCHSSSSALRLSRSAVMRSKAWKPSRSRSAFSSGSEPSRASSVSSSCPMSSSTVSAGPALATAAADDEDEEDGPPPPPDCFTRWSSHCPRNQTSSRCDPFGRGFAGAVLDADCPAMISFALL